MARFLYGATSADYATDPGGPLVPGAAFTAWSARTGGTQITDLTTEAGTAATTVTASSTGLIAFYGPDGTKTPIWLQPVAGGERTAVVPLDNVGENAYQVALSEGFEGTEEEWLESLHAAEPVFTASASAVSPGGSPTAAISGTYPNLTLALGLVTGATGAAGATAAALTTKGDVLSHDGSNGVRVAVGANETVLEADSTAAAGVKWGAAKAAKATIGNLLTDNQASGGDALGNATGITAPGSTGIGYQTDAARQGAGAVYVLGSVALDVIVSQSPRIPVTGSQTYTAVASSRVATASPQDHTLLITWFDAGGSVISQSAGSTLSVISGAWTDHILTAVSPSNAVSAFSKVYVNKTGAWGAYFDQWGFWSGSGGLWRMPGLPVPNLGIRANPANAAQVQVWNPGNSTWITV